MARRVWLALPLVVGWAMRAPAAGQLEVAAIAAVGERSTLQVQVRNVGDAAVSGVVPAVVYQGHEARGDHVAELPAGARDSWTLPLDPPAEPGSVPAVVHVHYEDAGGRHAVPAVARVSTPGLLPVPEARATLTASPVARLARAQLVLENPTASPIHGRVVVVLPAGLTIEPTSQAADVPAHGGRAIPLVLQNSGAAPGTTVPVFALFEYGLAGRRHLAIARATVPVEGGGPAFPPLVIGAGALATALALVALAWRRAAAKRHRQPLS